MPKTYDPFLVALSVLIAVWASYDALLIWSMHFVGMLARRLPVPVSYGAALVALSVVVAVSRPSE